MAYLYDPAGLTNQDPSFRKALDKAYLDGERNALVEAAKAVCNCGRCKSRGERRAADCGAEGVWALYHAAMASPDYER